MTTSRIAWIAGASSGVGAECARRLARAGMGVALSARRAERLEELAEELRAEGAAVSTVPLDVQHSTSIAQAHERVVRELGPVTDLVAAAGLNAPERHWRDQSMAMFESVIATNLTGVAQLIDQVLPGMRSAGTGTITAVSSFAAWRHSPHAGVAYSASKSALKPLVEMLNTHEQAHGIRACHLCPGDIDTDFLDQRPEVPDAHARSRMLQADDVARAVEFVHTAPARVCVDELVLSPVQGADPLAP
ncbi:SDR family oxidoreductase [Bogoriella caseilytica]|uniref:NADP-dependent 3-hydroxy acid dehydrogenase YdfG n=1 Tax=Bogoriella caseilytica TaxID=56055 RepID=A0A3N2BF60_9MICO|nr:SDR family NAD(P)-dependent oxidoreductase [Bogoriella caseilytica]ROR73674.1 NADP-dependent 3-hydroxy acid dehydrogenase YdfG [Bogoriella caseilytica]